MNRRSCWLCTLLVLLCSCAQPAKQSEVVVFAASSMVDAVDSLKASFESKYPSVDIVVAFGATSMLANQIVSGAGVDLIVTANSDYMNLLVDRQLVTERRALPVTNSLVETADLTEAGRIAIGDPGHVPVGIYAAELLRCTGLWDDIEPRIVPMIDTRAALAAYENGHVDAAVVYNSDLYLSKIEGRVLANPSCSPEIKYEIGLVGSEPTQNAQILFDFVSSSDQIMLWEKFRFSTL